MTICSIDRENFFKFLDAYELDEQTTSSSKKYNNAHFVVFLPYHFGLKDCILTGEGKGVLWVDSPIYKVTPETIWAIRAGSKFVAMNNLTTEKFRIDCSDENDDSKVVILAMELADISC